MKKLTTLLTLASLVATVGLQAQSYQFFVESNQILSAEGTPLNAGAVLNSEPVNLFYGHIAGADTPFLDLDIADLEGLKTALGGVEWTPMNVSAIGGVEWQTPGPITVDPAPGTPLLAIMNAAGPGSLAVGSQIALASGSLLSTNLQNLVFTPGSGNLNVLIGDAGSIQLNTIPVPEPAHFAAVLGLLGLGFVVYRRRK